MRCDVVTKSKLIFLVFILVFICESLTFAPLVLARLSPEQLCQARIYKIIGGQSCSGDRRAALSGENIQNHRWTYRLHFEGGSSLCKERG